MVINTLDPDWIRIRMGIQPKILDPDPVPDSMNPDPKHWEERWVRVQYD
jgi:hypothetical protein